MEAGVVIILTGNIECLNDRFDHGFTQAMTIFRIGECIIIPAIIYIKIVNDTKVGTGYGRDTSPLLCQHKFFRNGFLGKQTQRVEIIEASGVPTKGIYQDYYSSADCPG